MKNSKRVKAGRSYGSPRSTAPGPPEPSRWDRWDTLAATAAARIWVAFSVSAFAGGLIYNALTRWDNPLQSDDPYCAGLFVAAFCTAVTLVYGITEAIGGSVAVRRLAYFGSLVAVFAFLAGFDALHPNSEGHGILAFVASLIAVTGAVIYPFVSARLGRLYLLSVSIPGVLFLVGYWHVLTVMHARWS